MTSKKVILGAVTLLASVTLAACSNAGGKDIITMKGGSITTTEFYERAKNVPAAQQSLLELVIFDVFEKQYGDKVTAKEVNEAYDEMAEQYGESFTQALTSAGLTTETYKQQIRANKLVEYAVKQAAKKELTDENYKAAYEAYNPEVTAQIIKLDDEEKAKEVLAKAQAEGADFAALAKENSTDTATAEKGGEVKFDSTSTTVPAEVQTAIFALDAGQVGASVVSSVDVTTYTQAFYVVKLSEKTEKAADWKEYKDTLKDIIMSQKQNDATFVTSVVSAALKEANVKVKDEAFQGILSQYITDGTTTESSSSAE